MSVPGREGEAEEHEGAALARPLAEKRTRNSLGFSFPVFCFCFCFPSPSWPADAGFKHDPSSPCFRELQLLLQPPPLPPPQQTKSVGLHQSLLSAALLSERAQQEWFRVLPSHLQKKKSRGLQLREGAERVQRFAGAGGGCGWMRMGGYRGGGPGTTAPLTGPLRMTLGSLSSRVLVSTVTLGVSLNTQSARPAAAAVIG